MESQQHDPQPAILIRPAAIFAFIKIFGLLACRGRHPLSCLALFSATHMAEPDHPAFCHLPLCLYPRDTIHHNP
jgi:hypothetical protein